MLEYLQATRKDEADILDFANYVFSQNSVPHDFKKLLPKTYGRAGFGPLHLIAREEGRLVAMVGMLENQLRVSNAVLPFGYIGTVSVHPYYRGNGYMKELMRRTMDKARDKGLCFLALGGQRQRYNYFGYENAGSVLRFSLSATNLRHVLGTETTEAYQLIPLSLAGAEAQENAYRLFGQKKMTGLRSREDFALILDSWGAKALAAVCNGRPQGYFCMSRDDSLEEWALETPERLFPFVKQYLTETQKSEISVRVPGYDREMIALLDRVAETYAMSDAMMIQVLDWPRFIEGLMGCKAAMGELRDGEALLHIKNEASVLIKVEGGVPRVQLISGADQTKYPQVSLSPLKAVSVLTRSLPLTENLPEPFSRWFPLPFDILSADAF